MNTELVFDKRHRCFWIPPPVGEDHNFDIHTAPICHLGPSPYGCHVAALALPSVAVDAPGLDHRRLVSVPFACDEVPLFFMMCNVLD
jgi:hypothetical protein